MELDHVFLFTQQPQLLANQLVQFGILEGSANTHPGQGTACRRFYFQNAYLELVWVTSEEQLQSPVTQPTLLWQRAHSSQTGYAPFGLCLRRNNLNVSTPLFEQAWAYCPSFVPPGQYALVATNEAFPQEPMLFEFPFHPLPPTEYPPERRQPLEHPRPFQLITKVILTVPQAKPLSASMQEVVSSAPIELLPGQSYGLTLELDYAITGESTCFEHDPPLCLQW